MKMTIKVTNIKWDLDKYDDEGNQIQPEDLGLPTELEFIKKIDSKDDINEDDIECDIGEVLTDQYDWCFMNFDYEIFYE